jgi:GNAT superfamily N-acetyltransferase
MSEEISIAKPSDIEALIKLLSILFTQDIEFEPDYQKQKRGLDQIIQSPEIGEILILKIDGNIIGMVSLLYSISTALGGKVAILEDMVIHPDYRSQGYGKLLLNEAIVFAKRRNCFRITLLTDFDNETAIEFYKKRGFGLSKMVPMRLVFDEMSS